jgi:hypothetical protein
LAFIIIFKLKVSFPAKLLLFSDAIRNGIMIQMQEYLVVNGLNGWVEVNWEKGDGSSSYTVPAKLLLWGNVIFSKGTTILLACICSLKSSTEMKNS